MQLEFLGEQFDEARCRGMCDNCRKGLQVVEIDRAKEALIIIKLVSRCMEYQTKITAK